MHDERVIKEIEEIQEHGPQDASGEKQENQKDQRRGHPRKENGEQPVSCEGKAHGRILRVVRVDELILGSIGMHDFFPECDEELRQGGMRFHEVRMIQVFLRAGDVIVFIPKESGRILVVVDIRKKSAHDHKKKREPRFIVVEEVSEIRLHAAKCTAEMCKLNLIYALHPISISVCILIHICP